MTTTRRSVLAAIATTLAGVTVQSGARQSKSTEHRVEIVGAAFTPAQLTLSVGDSITWINLDIVPHTATAVDGSWDTDLLKPNERRRIVYHRAGAQAYFCRLHPTMIGSIKSI